MPILCCAFYPSCAPQVAKEHKSPQKHATESQNGWSWKGHLEVILSSSCLSRAAKSNRVTYTRLPTNMPRWLFISCKDGDTLLLSFIPLQLILHTLKIWLLGGTYLPPGETISCTAYITIYTRKAWKMLQRPVAVILSCQGRHYRTLVTPSQEFCNQKRPKSCKIFSPPSGLKNYIRHFVLIMRGTLDGIPNISNTSHKS